MSVLTLALYLADKHTEFYNLFGVPISRLYSIVSVVDSKSAIYDDATPFRRSCTHFSVEKHFAE